MRLKERAFLDTSIFVYTFDDSAPFKRDRARSIVKQALTERSCLINYQVVQEFLNVATRKFKVPLTASEAQLFLTRILMPLCAILPTVELYSQAVSISAEAGLSFYDSLIVSSASAAGCKVLLTEDLQAGRRIAGVEIRDPFRP